MELQPFFINQVTTLFSMRTVSLASSQICYSVDADIWCKRALKVNILGEETPNGIHFRNRF